MLRQKDLNMRPHTEFSDFCGKPTLSVRKPGIARLPEGRSEKVKALANM
jgi:hypothetical protein